MVAASPPASACTTPYGGPPPTALPTLVKFLELNWSKMAELEVQHMRKDQLIESLRARQQSQPGQQLRRPPRILHVQFQGAAYEWLDLEECGELLEAGDFAETIRENMAYYFGVPFECQAIYSQDELLKSAADFRCALQGPSPTISLHDIREMVVDAKEDFAHRLLEVNTDLERGLEEKDHMIEMLQREPPAQLPAEGEPLALCSVAGYDGVRPPPPERLSLVDSSLPRRPRMLYVEYQGQIYEWFNLDRHHGLVQACNAERTLRDNMFHYFGLPPERQAVSAECGPLETPADFSRALEAPCPLLRLRDTGAVHTQAPFGPRPPSEPPPMGLAQPAPGRTAAIAPGSSGAWAAPQRQAPLMPAQPTATSPPSPSLRGHGVRHSPLVDGRASPGQLPGIGRAVSFGDREAAAAFLCSSPRLLGGSITSEPLAVPPRTAAAAPEVELLLSRGAGGSGFGFAVVPASTSWLPEPTPTAPALGLSWIDEWGLLARWNRLYPGRALQPGDLLLSVNGCSGNAEAMREQLLRAEAIHILARQRCAAVH